MSRTRQTVSIGDSVTVPYWRNSPTYGTYPTCKRTDHIVTYNQSYVPTYYSKTITDVVTPNFRKRISKGEIINNPLRIQTVKASQSPYTWSGSHIDYPIKKCPANSYQGYGSASFESFIGSMSVLSTYGAPPDINIDSMKGRAINSAYSKVDISEATALVSLAEAKKTIIGLADIMKRVYKIYRAIARLDAKALSRELSPKELANRYMEYRYGLRPLVFDAKSLINAFNTIRFDKKPRSSFYARVQESGTSQSNHTFVVNNWSTFDYTKTISRNVTVSAGVLTDIEILSNLQILGVDKIFESAWELIPFSFILDWFFNIGTTLAAWTPNYGIRDRASWVTVDIIDVCSLVITNSHCLGVYDFENVNYSGSLNAVFRDYERIPNYTRHIFPTFNLRLDGFKLLDLAIILKNLIK